MNAQGTPRPVVPPTLGAGPERPLTGATGKVVFVLFFLSGISALVCQVIWVREFRNVFGATVHSAAVVTAVFMLGLGVGSWVAGRWADRRYQRDPGSLLTAYALAELGVGLGAQIVAVVLPHLEPLSAGVSSYARRPDGWYELAVGSQLLRYGVAVILTMPVTLLMGATLTLLIRHFVRRDLAVAGARVATLYGVNTAGAALGAFLVDFLLVPRLGLAATQSTAVLLNLAVGVAALVCAARERATGTAPREAGPEGHRDPEAGSERLSGSAVRRLLAGTGAAMMLTGFAGMGFEILWLRFLISMLGSNRAVFSLLLTVLLVGIWLGAHAGGVAQRRLGDPVVLFILVQSTLATVAPLLLFGFDSALADHRDLVDTFLRSPPLWRPVVEVWSHLRVVLRVVGLPAFLMGFAYPVANAVVQRAEGSVGKRAGFPHLANTLGAVSGAFAAGFVLLPTIGLQSSVVLLAGSAVLSAVPLLASVRQPDSEWLDSRLRRVVAVAAAVIAGAAVLLYAAAPGGALLAPWWGRRLRGSGC